MVWSILFYDLRTQEKVQDKQDLNSDGMTRSHLDITYEYKPGAGQNCSCNPGIYIFPCNAMLGDEIPSLILGWQQQCLQISPSFGVTVLLASQF